MTCKGVLSSLSDYIEGDAGKKVCRQIEEHLARCKRCRMHVDTMRRIVTLYKQWRTAPIPRDVAIRLRHTVSEILGGKAAQRPEKTEAREPWAAPPERTGKGKLVKVRKKPATRSSRSAGKKSAGQPLPGRKSPGRKPTTTGPRKTKGR